MDGHKFDRLARSMAAGVSRRSLLKMLGGAAGAAAVGTTIREASADNDVCFCHSTGAGYEYICTSQSGWDNGHSGGTGAHSGDYLLTSGQNCCSDSDCNEYQTCAGGYCQDPTTRPPCVPDCSGRVCGDDGCGGSCGTCPGGQYCEGGQCYQLGDDDDDDDDCAGSQEPCESNGDCCPDLICNYGYCEDPGGAKATICHFPPGNQSNIQVISVSVNSLPAHFAHGDSYYTDCCINDDCGKGGLCDQGTCVPGGDDDDDDDDCAGSGEWCENQVDCCKGLICYDSYCVECIPESGACEWDEDCCKGLSCHDGYCKPDKPDCGHKDDYCKVDADCCHGYHCKNGKCRKKPDKPHKPETPSGGPNDEIATVSSLPSTGTGDSQDAGSALGATVAGGAAALILAKMLRRDDAAKESANS